MQTPKTSPLILKCEVRECVPEYYGHAEADQRVHTKLNDEMLGFELWTEACASDSEARQRTEAYLSRLFEGKMEIEIKWA